MKALSCPFCGVFTAPRLVRSSAGRWWGMRCNNSACHVQPELTGVFGREQAIAAWNRRAEPAQNPSPASYTPRPAPIPPNAGQDSLRALAEAWRGYAANHSSESVMMASRCADELTAALAQVGADAKPSGRIHELKTWMTFFDALITGEKTFEARVNDRDFRVGDTLRLREFNRGAADYTGRELTRVVTYILKGGQWGVEEGHCILALAAMRPNASAEGGL